MCLTMDTEFDRAADPRGAVARFLDRWAGAVVDGASRHRVATVTHALAARLPRRPLGPVQVEMTFHDGHVEIQVVHAGRIERDVATTTATIGSPRRCDAGPAGHLGGPTS